MTTIERLQAVKKRGWTYHRLSQELNFPVNTLHRWITTGKIGNQLYEQVLAERLKAIPLV